MNELTWSLTESGVEPLAVDTTSSPTTVYIARNVEQVENKDEDGNVTGHHYHYESAKMTHEEYRLYKAEQDNAELSRQMTDLQLAVCEMYEASAENTASAKEASDNG